jgi:hypothetical protein
MLIKLHHKSQITFRINQNGQSELTPTLKLP